MGWMRSNTFTFNPDKTLLIRTSLVLGSGCTLMLDYVTLIPKASVHSLRELLGMGLLHEERVVAVARSTYDQLRLWFTSSVPSIRKKLASVSHVLIMSQLSYFNVLYMGCPCRYHRNCIWSRWLFPIY